jgi:thiamine-monophosphate kinase
MESDLVAWIRQQVAPHARVRVGPGDDAAVLWLGDSTACVVTVDMLTDGVDFHLDRAAPRRVGRKALAVNLSDVAAMAARPVAAFVAVALPRRGGRELGQELLEGMLPLAAEHDVSIAGGDTNSWDGPLAISVTLIGEPSSKGPLLRRGAQPGDRIVVTGELGGSILGRHLDFQPRVQQALWLHERYQLHAGMDVSDGLSLDLGRLCDESCCGAVVWTEAVPISDAARELERADGTSALQHALSDGEDFELLLAVPPEEAERILADATLGVRTTMIGEFVETRGLWQSTTPASARTPLPRLGYEHRFEP